MDRKVLAGSSVFRTSNRSCLYCQADVAASEAGGSPPAEIELGIQALLRDRVVQAYYHYIERGWITLHGLEAAEKMYTEYHNLGGNGTVTKLMEDLRELPVRDKATETEEKESKKEPPPVSKNQAGGEFFN